MAEWAPGALLHRGEREEHSGQPLPALWPAGCEARLPGQSQAGGQPASQLASVPGSQVANAAGLSSSGIGTPWMLKRVLLQRLVTFSLSFCRSNKQ